MNIIGEVIDTHFLRGPKKIVNNFLERELVYLETQKVFADRTYGLVKNLEFHQVYLLSTNFAFLDRFFSYQFCFILMRKKQKLNYVEIFPFLKQKFESKFERQLELFKINLDCESAAFLAIKDTWPYARTVPRVLHA